MRIGARSPSAHVVKDVPLPTVSALMWCPGEVQGPLSCVLQLVRGRVNSFAQHWDRGGIFPSFPPTRKQIRGLWWSVPFSHLQGQPTHTSDNRVNFTVLPDQEQGLLSWVLQLVRRRINKRWGRKEASLSAQTTLWQTCCGDGSHRLTTLELTHSHLQQGHLHFGAAQGRNRAHSSECFGRKTGQSAPSPVGGGRGKRVGVFYLPPLPHSSRWGRQ